MAFTNADNYFVMREKGYRNGEYGVIITKVETKADGSQEREEQFIREKGKEDDNI